MKQREIVNIYNNNKVKHQDYDPQYYKDVSADKWYNNQWYDHWPKLRPGHVLGTCCEQRSALSKLLSTCGSNFAGSYRKVFMFIIFITPIYQRLRQRLLSVQSWRYKRLNFAIRLWHPVQGECKEPVLILFW